MTDAAISLRGLRKTYRGSKGQPEKQALKGIDLDIPRGSVFGLLGPNGAGKSTLINILAGLVIKTAGQVTIWGHDQDRNPRQARAAIGVMPQELNLDPFFTPRGALEVQAGLYGVPKSQRRSDEILELVGLSDKAEAYARTLSGGMRRRLLLAKALVHHPKILVLDEPTAGVDIELRQMLWANVRKLNQQGMTIILTTHYLEEAQEMCDEIAIINHGEKVAQDSTTNLLGRMDGRTMVITPEDPVTALPAAPGVQASLRDDGSLSLHYRSPETSAEQVLEAVRQAGIRIRDVRTEEADLEDVFLALTSSRADDAPADDQDQPRRGLHRVKL
ncbi:ABC transporter ATP-binding protein [Ruegeria arenilitoris]|uniref:Daunorubicin/doxorubicin resistance ATP-binding protein DrrA n=1 Tax=Ruegeria arenilitoris TaxID=1173585 RepID=A0A238KQ65_9RHOB|nr:ABC transporter ATP-binding protein [Ruegeria arenilitoris]SMX44878.1 Daunorubicin/doxorubicin resistance ATP-binding protein DrrA [Ruegeria arenilitoris]